MNGQAIPDLVSYEEAAQIIDASGKQGVTVRTIRRLVAEGVLQKVKIGRHPAVHRKQVLALVLEPVPEQPTRPRCHPSSMPRHRKRQDDRIGTKARLITELYHRNWHGRGDTGE